MSLGPVIGYRFKLRRGTAFNWTYNNPILLAGEPGIETDTRKWKTGNGVDAWNDLLYMTIDVSEIILPVPTGTGFRHITAGVEDPAAKLVDTADINDAQVTLAKIANAAANVKLLGSGAAGSGAAYSELTLGTGLSMAGTTLNASGSSDVTSLLVAFASVANGTTVETDLFNQNLAAGELANNGDYIEFTFHGVRDGDSNKVWRVYFGAAIIFTYNFGAIGTPLSPRFKEWTIQGRVMRTGAATQRCFTTMITGESLSPHMAVGQYEATSQTLSSALAVRLTGQGGASDEITFHFGSVKKVSAP